MRVISCSDMHESEGVTPATGPQKKNGPTGQSECRMLTYVHQYCFLLSVSLQGPTDWTLDRLTDPKQRIQKLFKNVIRNNFNDFLSINFLIIHSIFLSGSFILRYYCRSSTTSASSFLKFWRAASRNEMGQQLNDAPS